ncbi:RICIN domain-containing protein [Streptomyces platensis]
MPALSQRCLPARTAVRILAALVAALATVIAPITPTVAHADSGTSDLYVSISPRDNGGLSFKHIAPMLCENPEHAEPWSDGGVPDGSGVPPCHQNGPNALQLGSAATEQLGSSNTASNQQFTLVPTSDGSFNLKLTDEGTVVCLAEPSNGLFNEQPCPTSGTWTLQPASDGANYFLIRHVGDNMCIAPTGDVSSGTPVGVSTCDGGSTKQQWSITTADGANLPNLTNGAAINLGGNKITVCNWGGYAARATIDYQIKENPADDTVTTGHYAIESFPVHQCRTAPLAAGKIVATVTLRRFTDFNMNAYAFSDGDEGSYANAGNDKITAVYTLGGVHANATYNMYGTSCDSSSGFEQDIDSQVASTNQQGQVGCSDGASYTGTITNAVSTAASQLINLVFSVVFR